MTEPGDQLSSEPSVDTVSEFTAPEEPIVSPLAVWSEFTRAVSASKERALSEVRAAAASIEGIVGRQHERLAETISGGCPRKVAAVVALYRTQVPRLIDEPMLAYSRADPQQRSLAALDNYDRAVDQLILGFPDSMTASGAEWTAAIGSNRVGPSTRLVLRARRRVTLSRAALQSAALKHCMARRLLEGQLLAALGEICLDLLAPWQAVRRPWLSTGDNAVIEWRLETARARLDARVRELTRALGDLDRSLSRFPAVIARRLAMGGAWPDRRFAAVLDRNDRRRTLLGRQTRAIDTFLDVHARLARALGHLVTITDDALSAVAGEHRRLLDRIDQSLGWLENGAPEKESPDVEETVDAFSGQTGLPGWTYSAEALFEEIPETVEVTSRPVARPWLRHSWTARRTRDVMRRAFEQAALPLVGEGMRAVEKQHQIIALEISRARDVVSFARESAREEPNSDGRVEQEGIANAQSLLRFHREQLQNALPRVDALFATGLLRTIAQTSQSLDDHRFDLLQQAARSGVPAARMAWQRLKAVGRERTAVVTRRTVRAYRAGLVKLGWVPEPLSIGPHVMVRGGLIETLGGESNVARLPLLYQRLFRLAPVEDPRFLIGRAQELVAIADARKRWEQGRDVAVLFVGARGSGKTSLINCAMKQLLADLPVVRSEFTERLSSREELYAFMAALLGVDAGQVEHELTSRRRIIILEELERTFLRTTSGYDATRSLMALIAATSRQNLWMISVNLSCFRLLNAALRLESNFSHRINAMAVEPMHLREAILMRHNLSGLRLHYAMPPEGRSIAQRILYPSGAQASAEGVFFDALARESGGVFRAAFALWQRYADRVDGGVLHMKPPTSSPQWAVMGALSTTELFTLLAILQHGSLTPQEHSRVFQTDIETSRAQMDNLLGREIIEPDPGRCGFRIVPDASQFVRETLFGRNLG